MTINQFSRSTTREKYNVFRELIFLKFLVFIFINPNILKALLVIILKCKERDEYKQEKCFYKKK